MLKNQMDGTRLPPPDPALLRSAAELYRDAAAKTKRVSFGDAAFDAAFGGGLPMHGIHEVRARLHRRECCDHARKHS